MTRLRALVRRMIVESETELECALAIKRFEGWRLDDEVARNRLMQTLRSDTQRHFSADWLPIVVRIVVWHGGEELVTGVLDQARRDALRDLQEAKPQPARVGPRGRQEDVA